jgi:HPt (histidine-containing phosphotransfer) domain-containing protein
MSEDVIDLATFRELQDATGAEFVTELVDTFLQEAPAMLEGMRHALAARDVEAFRRTAHSLKSNGNTFGARTLGALARDLELSAQTTVQAGGAGSLDALAAEYARVVAALGGLRDA